MGVLRKNDVPSLLKGLFVASCVSEAVYLLYMSLCNRDLELIGSFRPVIPVIHYIRNYIIRDRITYALSLRKEIQPHPAGWPKATQRLMWTKDSPKAVSYTHLTLPTKRIV